MNNAIASAVKSTYEYAVDGFLTNRRTGRRSAGWVSSGGYRSIAVYANGKSFNVLYHRAVWFWHHGYTEEWIDHINRNPLDNRIENLRPCNQSENLANRTATKKSKTGIKGVRRKGNRFQAQIRHWGMCFYLGSFKTAEEAARAYDLKAKELFGSFSHPNNA